MINVEIIIPARAEDQAIKALNARAGSLVAVADVKAKVVKVAAAVNSKAVVVKVTKAIATSNNTSFMLNNI
jgi:hypothetical protein